MKKLLVFLIIIISTSGFSQTKNFLGDFLSLKSFPKLTDEEKLNLVIIELRSYGKAFKYSDELEEGKFTVEKSNSGYVLKIFIRQDKNYKSSKYIKTSAVDSLIIASDNSIRQSMINEADSEFRIENFEKFLLYEPIIGTTPEADYLSEFKQVIFRYSDKVFVDKDILYGVVPSGPTKVLNRERTRTYLEQPNGQPADLYSDVTDGVIVPDGNGNNAKVFTVDNSWHRIMFCNKDFAPVSGEDIFARHGIKGTGLGQFNFPTGISYGPIDGQGYRRIFIAENMNNRIQMNGYRLESWGHSWYMPTNAVIRSNLSQPYDISHHSGNQSDNINTNDNTLWFSEQGIDKGIRCINMNTGADIYNFFAFQYKGKYYDFYPGKIDTYVDYINNQAVRSMLAFVDLKNNAIVFIHLENGTTPNINPPVAYEVIQFPDNERVTSVKFMTAIPGSIFPVNVLISSNDLNYNGHLHTCRVLFAPVNGQWVKPYTVEYNGSSWTAMKGNTLSPALKSLNNIEVQYNYADIFTTESWNNEYGMRWLKPGVDIIADNITAYCYPAEYATYTVKLTNPAKVRFTAQYRPSNGQYSDINIYINNLYTPNPTLSLPSGTSQLTVSRVWRGDGPGYNMTEGSSGQQDNMTPDEEIVLKAEFIPLDENFSYTNSIHITRVWAAVFSLCNSGGGCPYLYTFSPGMEETPEPYVQDNNLLHRSEFDQNAGNDIEDKYILNTSPTYNVNEEGYLFKVRELDNDYSYFDQFKLVAIDHPLGTNFGITEHGDYILYFPDITCSPDYAEHNGDDVTDILHYDSLINDGDVLNGDEEDEVNASFCEGEYRLSSRKNIINIFKNSLFFNNILTASREPVISRSELIDSMAVVMDPSLNRIISHNPIAKRPAGVVRAYDMAGSFSSGDIEFARRQNSSTVIIPVGQGINVDSVEIDWGKDFSLSYLVTTPVFYGGYVEHEMQLVSAVNSNDIDLTDNVEGSNDDRYAEMDNSTEITLKFAEANEPLQEGWVRDYVFITNGKYVKDLNRPDVSNAPGYDESLNIPKEYRLHQNFPNPFNPFTTIKYDLPKETSVTIKIYDLLGRELLKQTEFKSAGYHEYQFNGFNFSSGVYFYRIETTGFVDTKRMVLLK